MADDTDRKQYAKRGKSSQRASASTRIRGVTTSAINTGLATALNHAQYSNDPAFYAVHKDGGVLLLTSPLPIDVHTIPDIPNIYGEFAPQTAFLHNFETLHRLTSLTSLYEQPIEFQVASDDGVGRFGIPFLHRSSPNPFQENEVQNLLHNFFPMNVIGKKSLTVPERKQRLFDQSSKLVHDVFQGQSAYLPWGRRRFSI